MLVNKPSSIVGKSGFFLLKIFFFFHKFLFPLLITSFFLAYAIFVLFLGCNIFFLVVGFFFFPLCHLFLIDLGQNQQQHLNVHSEGVCRERISAVAVGVSDR